MADKKLPSEYNTSHTDELVCPYCGNIEYDRNYCGIDYDEGVEIILGNGTYPCRQCQNIVKIDKIEHETYYYTRKLEQK